MNFTVFGGSPEKGPQITRSKTPFLATLGLAGVLLAATSCKELSENTDNYQPIENVQNTERSAQKMDSIANKRFDDIFNELFAEGSNESTDGKITSRIIECPNGKITLHKGKDYKRIEISRNNSDDIYILCEEGGSYIYKGYKGKVLEYKDGDNESCFDFLSKIIKEINCAYGREIFDPNINFAEEIQNLRNDSIPLTSTQLLAKDSIESAD